MGKEAWALLWWTVTPIVCWSPSLKVVLESGSNEVTKGSRIQQDRCP